jgi:hypothetical protein
VKTITVSTAESFPSPLILTLTQAVSAGSILRLRASGVSMLRALCVTAVTARCPGAPSLPILHHFSWPDMQQNWMWHIHTLSLAQVEVPVTLSAGTQLEIHGVPAPEASGPTGTANVIADLTWTLFLGRVSSLEDLEFVPLAAPLHLHFVAGPVDHLEAFLKADGQLLVTGFDHAGNPSLKRNHTVRVEGAVTPGAPSTILRVGERVVVDPAGGRVCVRDEEGRRAYSNAQPVALDGTPIYLGEFHWHTDFSGDGQRTLSAALTSARDELGLDFAGPADHMLPDGTYMQRLPIEQAEICRRFDAPGRFCALPGAELSGRYGHTNLLAADWDTFLTIVKRFPHELQPVWRKMPDTYPLEVLAALCPAGKAMIIPHHTNMDSSVSEGVVRDDGRPYWSALHWPQATPLLQQGLRLVEIVQQRGAFETEVPDPDWRVAWGGLGGSVRTALLRGHRIGFVGGSDNHMGWPSRATGRAGYDGLTALQAPELDGPALFDALYRRRCYATSGARIVADATLNGEPLGSELVLPPGARREFRIRIRGTAPLVAVQIVSLGAVLVDFVLEPESWDFEITWADERPGRPLQDVYYYVRARQADGHCAWLSPWWVDPL